MAEVVNGCEGFIARRNWTGRGGDCLVQSRRQKGIGDIVGGIVAGVLGLLRMISR
jgi:hypothetical protein